MLAPSLAINSARIKARSGEQSGVSIAQSRRDHFMDRNDELAKELTMFRTALEIAGLPPNVAALPQDHQTIIGAMRFHYLDWNGSGAPIVFLHGGGLTAHTWDCVAATLRDRYRCVALDQRGHGDSEWSPVIDYRIASHVGDIEGYIDALGLERPILVG